MDFIIHTSTNICICNESRGNFILYELRHHDTRERELLEITMVALYLKEHRMRGEGGTLSLFNNREIIHTNCFIFNHLADDDDDVAYIKCKMQLSYMKFISSATTL